MLHSTRLDRQAVALRPARNAPLTLRIPEPAARPGEPVDFSKLRLSAPGAVRRPSLDTEARSMHDLAYELIRVLDDNDFLAASFSDAKSCVVRTDSDLISITSEHVVLETGSEPVELRIRRCPKRSSRHRSRASGTLHL